MKKQKLQKRKSQERKSQENRQKGTSKISAKQNKAFINDLAAELAENAFAPRGLNVEDLFPKKARKRIERTHPVLHGSSPNFFYLIRGKKRKKEEHILAEPINKQVIAIAKKSKKTFLKDMEKNMNIVREFLTFVIGPRMLPLLSSVEEAKDILQEITGGEVTSTLYTILMRQANHAAEVKVASFISKYLELDDEEQERFLERLILEKQSVYELLKVQKMVTMQRSGKGNDGLHMRQVSAVQRRDKNRSAARI